MKTRRIGLLTGGGDCPGLNAVIRSVVRTAIGEFGWEVFGIRQGFEGLVEPVSIDPLTYADVRGILPRGGTILGTANRGNPFARQIVKEGKTHLLDQSAEVVATVREFELDGMIVIGGDGTLSIAHLLAEHGLPIVGVPKTIDNDLSATDLTFGFDTAVLTATDALDKLHTTAESHHRVMVLEVMGRDAGWIALHAGIAGGADVILIPEIPFSVDAVIRKVHQRDQAGSHFSIVIVAEGARPAGGGQLYVVPKDELGPGRLGGMGNWVGNQLGQRSGHETRVTVLGHLQRGGSPTPFDRVLSTRYGSAAVRMVANGRFDCMTALRGQDIIAVPLADAIGRIKTVPPDGDLVQTARGLGISFG